MKKASGLFAFTLLLLLAFATIPLASAAYMGPGELDGSDGTTLCVIDAAVTPVTNDTFDVYPLLTTFTVNVSLTNVVGASAVQVGLSFDPTILQAVGGPTEGDWSKGAGTIWIPGAIDNVLGKVTASSSTTAPVAGIDYAPGDYGTVITVDFQVVGVGPAVIAIGPNPVTDCFVLDTIGASLDYYSCDMSAGISPPPPYPPTASFTWGGPSYPYPGTYNFDASGSTAGFDGTDPCPITEYWWDWENDGTVDDVLGVPTTTHDLAAGTHEVNLTVYAPPGSSPDPAYVAYDSEVKTITIFVVPAGPSIDVFVQKSVSGKGPLMICDSFAPGEEVTLIAEVTYNGAPVFGELVVFQAFMNLSIPFMYATAVSQPPDGNCSVSFRIPMPPSYGNDLFSAWYGGAQANIGGQTVEDWTGWTVGWLLELVSVETVDDMCMPETEFLRGETIGFKIHIKSIALIQMETCLTILVQDEVGHTLGYFQLGAPSYGMPLWVIEPGTGIGLGYPVMPSDTWLVCFLYIVIPDWAFVGVGTVRVNLYTNEPYLAFNPDTGVPYCPEITALFSIVYM